jgi:PAS domain-containing protein
LLTFTQQLAGASAEKLRVETDQAAVREGAPRSRLEAAEAAAAWGQVERHLQELTDALPVKISLVSRDLRYQYVNHAYEGWFGLSRENLI